MLVAVHSVLDYNTGKNLWFGVGQEGYEECMAFLRDNPGDRYEYFGGDEDINFKWDVIEAEFRRLMVPTDGIHGDDVTEYDGAVFFGDLKLEFMRNDIAGCYNNLFLYGEEGYEWLEDGTPYNELLTPAEEIRIPKRRTFNAFARNIEDQILRMLNDHTDLIEHALRPTDPNKWYPTGKRYTVSDITRDI